MIKKIVATIALFASVASCHKGKSQEEQPTLIGGREADPKDWPASVYARMGNSACTATVVGERVLIIASHCVAHGGTASFSIGANAYTSTCSRSPLYRQGTDHDLALCKISTPVRGIAFENVNQDASLIQVGREILLTGYGCIHEGGGGGNDGIFRIGEAKIIQLPSPYDLVAQGKAALCFGDSGGAAYLYTDDAKTRRVQVTTNSKGDIRTTSYLTSTSSQASIDFLKSWSTANSVSICGVSADAVGCRDAVTPPQPSPGGPSPKPEPGCRELYTKLGFCLKDSNTKWYE